MDFKCQEQNKYILRPLSEWRRAGRVVAINARKSDGFDQYRNTSGVSCGPAAARAPQTRTPAAGHDAGSRRGRGFDEPLADRDAEGFLVFSRAHGEIS
jgi:hypothetical protein